MNIYILFSSFSAALAALLAGFHSGIIATSLLYLEKEFQLGTIKQGWVVSLFVLGAAGGALMGGWIADHIGRKKALILTAFLFIIATFPLSYANGFLFLLMGRLIAGIASGIATVCVPLYIVETSPPETRGALASFNQLFMGLGILIAYLISFYYSKDNNWSSMFFFGLFLALLQLGCLLFIDETPCWLHEHGKKRVSKEKKISWKGLLGKKYRKVLIIGLGISLFQQTTGINSVIYYAPKIFQFGAEGGIEYAVLLSILLASVNVIMTFIALWLVDWLGRRILLLFGFGGLFCSLALLGASFHLNELFPIIAILAFMAFFALTVGPCTWILISEIFPEAIRGKAMGLSVFVNWFANYLVAFSFLPLVAFIGTPATFWLYGIFSVISFWFIWKEVPETKGKTLQEIQTFWKN